MQLTISGAVTREEIVKMLDERSRRTGYAIELDSFTWVSEDEATFTLRPLTPEEKEELGMDPAPMTQQVREEVKETLATEFAAFISVFSDLFNSHTRAPLTQERPFHPQPASKEPVYGPLPTMDELAVSDAQPQMTKMDAALMDAVPTEETFVDEEAKTRAGRLRRIREEQQTAGAYDALSSITPFTK